MIRLRTIVSSLLLLGCSTAYAVAAQAPAANAVLPPPTPGSNRDAPAAWVGMLLMFIIVAIIITISMMPSRRGHQD
ncbi:MAG: hypothetical protein P8L37_06290 [Phycisphaerales bacterium]|nr:hypothetical protein [Phycisphaerales bacterium]